MTSAPKKTSKGRSGAYKSRIEETKKRPSLSDAAPSPLTPQPAFAPGLYLVATPIGNLSDISLRALDMLRSADHLYCEDTRTTRILLSAHGIAAKGRLFAYHEHNAARMRPHILGKLSQNAVLALLSDAGTPLISDPGYKLVEEALAAGHDVIPLPGPSAPIAALIASGLPTDRFFFGGFLPAKSSARRRELQELAFLPATLIFFESARRLPALLTDMADILGPRRAAVGREITKRFEEFRRDSLAELALTYAAETPRGEITLIVGPPETASQGNAISGGKTEETDIAAALTEALAQMSLRDAVQHVTRTHKLPRAEVYAHALRLKKERS
jgi:16S rRNA (cytidine1402-2'-O)-methyltransferase